MGDDVEETEPGKVWLFDGASWQLVADPIEWSEDGGDDVHERYEAAGYAHRSGGGDFLRLGVSEEVSVSGVPALALWLRPGRPPECLIEVQGSDDSSVSLYAARLPDGLDLMARWAPLVQTGVLLNVIDQIHERVDLAGKAAWPPGGGIVEAITHRAMKAARQADSGLYGR